MLRYNYRVMCILFRLYTLYILLFLLIPSGTAAQWNHFVTNFPKDLFGDGAQTWQIKTYGREHFYFANSNGLLEYNGSDWTLFPMDNLTGVRSIHTSANLNRIYAGGESEFGYFEAGTNGQLIYNCLSEDFVKNNGLSGGIWGIYEVDNILYYVSDRFIVKQIGDEFTLIPSEHKIDCSAIVNNILYLGTFDGIKILVGNTLFSLPEGDLIKGKTIRGIVPFGSGFLVATARDDLFIRKDNKTEPYLTGHEQFMSRNEIFTFAISDEYLAVGTIHQGLLLLSRDDFSPQYYNEDNGLQNNTVLSICFDNRQNIWLGLDNGIDHIALDSNFSNLYTYPNSKGAGYSSLIKGDRLYLATNRGLFHTGWPVRFTEEGAAMEFYPELSGQVWELADYDGGIFCMHDKGLFILRDNRIEQIPGLRGAISLTHHETDRDKCWISTYDGFYLLQKQNGKWGIAHQVDGIRNWPKNVLFEAPDVLWVRLVNSGMERIELDTAGYRVKESRVYTKKDGLASTTNLYAFKIGGEVYFISDSGFFNLDRQTDKIVKSKKLNDTFSKGTFVVAEQGNRLFALSKNGIQASVINATGILQQPVTYSFTNSEIDFIRYYEALKPVNDSLIIVPNEYGFALLNTSGEDKARNNTLFIKNVHITYPKDSLIFRSNFLNHNLFPDISYTSNAIRIEYDIRSLTKNKAVRFRYRLNPDPLWSDFTTATVKEYNHLKEGGYTFEVEAFYPDGEVARTSFSFTILPPWYRSLYAGIVYLLLFLSLIRLIYLLEEKRLTRRKKKELAEKEQQIRLIEQEFAKEDLRKEQQIIELKNENLEQELKHKSQEMANLMINLSRKNEALIDIKEELNKVMSEMKGDPYIKPKRMVAALTGRIDSNIQSDDMLKRFEEQFDLVHNNFIGKLRSRHPDLTAGELKMCTYLKMDLTSKEIAPLLNLSVRGVETLRYRLRKKLELEREDNLIEYLNSL